MKVIIRTLIIVLSLGQLYAQELILGRIVDDSGAPLFGATCTILSDPQHATVSDFDGNWQLNIDPIKRGTTEHVEIRYLGYAAKQVALSEFGAERVNITMAPDNNVISEVIIKGQNPVSEDFSAKEIDRLDIYFSPLSKADPLNAIQALPASTNTDESANPSLRGSDPNRTIVVIDGVPIRNPVKFTQLNGTGNFSIFNTEFLENQQVYASNPPLTYANSTAGLVELNLRKTPPEDGFRLGLSIAQMSGMWNKAAADDQGFLTVYANQSFSDVFLSVNGDKLGGLNSFRNTDTGIRFYRQLSDKVSLSLYNYASTEAYDVDVSVLGTEAQALGTQKRNFSVASLRWGNLTNHWSFNNGFDISQSDFSFGSIQSDNLRRELYSSINYKRVGEVFTLQTGVNYIWVNDDFEETLPINYYDNRPGAMSYDIDTQLGHNDLQYYLYGKVLLEDVILSGALRTNLPMGDQEHFLSKQLSMKYTPASAHSILLSAGTYHGYNFPTSNNLNLDLQESKQLSVEYYYTGDELQLSAAAYIKEEDNPLSFAQRFLVNGAATTHIKGVELALSKQIGDRWQVDISNTFLDIAIDATETSFRGAKDLDYFAKLGITYFNNDVFNLGVSYISRPGRHYTDIIGPIDFGGVTYPQFESQINGSQYRSYNNLSITFNRQFDLPNDKALVLFGVVNNVLDTRNQNYELYDEGFNEVGHEYYSRRWLYFGGMFLL